MAATMARFGHTILPLTDTMGFWALVPAIHAAARHGLTLKAGMHIPLERGCLIAFPEDAQGYRALCRLATGYHHHINPVTPNPIRAKSTSPHGQINSCPCPESLFDHLSGTGRFIALGAGGLAAATRWREKAQWQPFWGITSGLSKAKATTQAEIANNLQAPPVAVTPLVFTQASDRLLGRILQAIHANSLLTQVSQKDFRLPASPETTAAPFGWFPEAISGTQAFLRQPTWLPPLGQLAMPKVETDSAVARQRLHALAEEGARTRYGTITPAVRHRLEHEFSVICDKDFADYFLLVHEIVVETERQGHRVLGRGSAANSLIAYALRLTHVDPLKHGLFFERFLNPFRSSPPDIDLDFSWRIRDEIYHFLRRRWGTDNVALISTHVTMGGRGAFHEAGKALGIPAEEIRRFTKAIGSCSAQDFLNEADHKPEAKNIPRKNRAFLQTLRLAAMLEGTPTHLSLHAGGVVIAPGGLDGFTPVQPSSKAIPMTQPEMHAIEELGLVKIDLLAQRSLGVFADLTRDLGESLPEPAILDNTQALADDPKVHEALRQGKTMGVFYIESPGMRSLLKKLDCQGFEELTAASSVIRPGVAESGMMQEYIRRHRHPEEIPPQHPAIEPLLRQTHGVMIYQEDVMKVVQALAGFSLGEADSLRRAMSGKSRGPDEMIKTRDAFLSAAQARGHDPQFIAETWRQIESFCGYAFCKAHSASYAVLSLQLLWFKEYHPAHFFAGVLNNRGGFYSPQAYIFEARRAGLTVLPPDLDHSRLECLGQGNFIRLGFSFIVDLRQETTRRILQEREITPFTDFPDFLSRVRPATNEIDQLIDSGTLNRFGTPAGLRWQSRLLPSPGLFATETPVPAFAGKALTDPEKARLEARSLGVVLCRHPLEFFKLHTHTVFSDQLAEKSGKTVLLNGILIAGKSVRTKRGERMKFLTFDDGHGTFDVTFFPKTWRKLGHWFTDGIAFQIIGEVENTWGMPTITAKNALPLVESF